MSKVMIFIDGSWLYKNLPRLASDYGNTSFRIDYGKLAKVLGEKVREKLDQPDIDIVRTYLFASIPENYDLADEDLVEAQRDFFNMLKEEFHYETEIFPINFKGRRVRAGDREPADKTKIQEKCVDIALASSCLYYAAIPHAYDIAIVLVGDRDYVPVLQHVRRLGKRVAIASIKGSCPEEFIDPYDKARIKDTDIIWINDYLSEIELKPEKRQLECESPNHVGDRKFWTEYRPRKGERVFCDACRQKFREQKARDYAEYVKAQSADELLSEGIELPEGASIGIIEKIIKDKGYGFLRSKSGEQYYFHFTDLDSSVEWSEIAVGVKVAFEVKAPPSDKAGAVRKGVKLLQQFMEKADAEDWPS